MKYIIIAIILAAPALIIGMPFWAQASVYLAVHAAMSGIIDPKFAPDLGAALYAAPYLTVPPLLGIGAYFAIIRMFGVRP